MSAEGGGDGGRREEEVVIEMSTSTAPVAGKRSSDPPAPRHLNLKDLGIAGLSKEPTGATLTKEGSFNRPATTRRVRRQGGGGAEKLQGGRSGVGRPWLMTHASATHTHAACGGSGLRASSVEPGGAGADRGAGAAAVEPGRPAVRAARHAAGGRLHAAGAYGRQTDSWESEAVALVLDTTKQTDSVVES